MPEYPSLRIVPIFQKQAKAFIARHHRHNVPSLTCIFSLGLECDGELVGVAMVGLPKSRMLMDGKTLEVTRTCCRDGIKNANSMLYGACARAAAALGYEKLVTYTLTTESGISLRAAGWVADEELREANVRNWENRHKSFVTDLFGNVRIPEGPKIRWWKRLPQAKSAAQARVRG